METAKIFTKNLYFFVDMLKNEGFRCKKIEDRLQASDSL